MSTDIKDVFVVTEKSDNEKNVEMRIGLAFVNKDQSLHVVLDAIPLSGHLHIQNRRSVKTQTHKKEKP